MQANDSISTIYLAVVIVVVIYNILSFAISIGIETNIPEIFFNTKGTSLYTDGMVAFAARVILIPTVYTLELLIAAHVPKDTKLPIPSLIQKIFYCCRCFSSNMQSKIIQTLAVWHIMIFIQGLAMSAIPVGVFFLINPLWLISVLGSIACVMLFGVVFVAYLLHHCTTNHNHRHPCKKYTILCLRITETIMSVFFVVPLLSVYLIMVYRNSDGAIGFLGSFLPSVILSIAGWTLKKKMTEMNLRETSYNTANVYESQEYAQMYPVGDAETLIDIENNV